MGAGTPPQTWHLAQLNVGTPLYPVDDPKLRDFMEALDSINRLAEQSSGFVWRFQTESGNATDAQHPWTDLPNLLVNMSVWESAEQLKGFVYHSNHVGFYRRRSEWFEKAQEAYAVLWWIPAGHIPSLEEAKTRLEHYRIHGATPQAFWFTQLFPAPV
jgi:hypothetical protein